MYTLTEHAFKQSLGYVSLIGIQLSEQVVTQAIKHIDIPVINNGFCQHEIEYFSSFIAYQMQLEAEVPSHRALAVHSQSLEHLVATYPLVMTNGNTCAIDEAYACAFSET